MTGNLHPGVTEITLDIFLDDDLNAAASSLPSMMMTSQRGKGHSGRACLFARHILTGAYDDEVEGNSDDLNFLEAQSASTVE